MASEMERKQLFASEFAAVCKIVPKTSNVYMTGKPIRVDHNLVENVRESYNEEKPMTISVSSEKSSIRASSKNLVTQKKSTFKSLLVKSSKQHISLGSPSHNSFYDSEEE